MVKRSLGAKACFLIKGSVQQYLSVVLQILKPPPGRRSERLVMICCPQACRPQTSETSRLMMLTTTYLTTNHELITPSFTIKLVTVSLELRLLVSRAWVHCVPLSLAKQ